MQTSKKTNSRKELPQTQNTAKIGERGFNKTDQNAVRQTQQPEDLYTAVKKPPKCNGAQDGVPPILPHTTEKLYTAVARKSKGSLADDKGDAPPIPPYKVEDVYTVVKKKPKDSAQEGEEDLPPIPPHTVEELYTAVVKKQN